VPVNSGPQEQARVRSRIGSLILEFFAIVKNHEWIVKQTFHMQELLQFVEEGVSGKVAPDSPGRILRQLRQQRLLNYEVVSRRQSLYRVLPVERPAEQAELFGARAS